MKKKIVRLISAVLSAVMTLTAVPLSAFAEGEEHTHDGEGNVITTPLDFREKKADENGIGWSWVYDTKTLTLNGVNIQATTDSMSVVTVPDGTEIVLKGENTIVQTDTGESYTYVLSAVNNQEVNCDGTMTISGDGVLNAENRSTDSMARSLGGTIIINGGTVNATGKVVAESLEIHNDGALNAEASAVSNDGAAVGVKRGITVDGNGSLTAVGGAVENEYVNNGAILLNSNFGDKISVSGNGSITVPEGNAAKVGIYYDGNKSIDAEISGGKVTAYGTKCGIYKVNLIMSGTGSVYTTGGSYAIGQTVPTIDEDEFVVKGSTEFKAEESSVTANAKYNSGYYEIGGADAKTVVIKPDTEPSIKLGKQIGAVYADDVGNNSSAYFYITAKNFADGAFVPEAEWVTSPGRVNIDAHITKTGGKYVCEVICDEPDLSRQYELRVKCGEVYSNTVTVTVGKPHFALTSRDSQSKYYINYNGEQKITLRYDVEAGYENQDGLQYNWSSDSKKYDIADLGTVTTVDGVETLVFSDNVPEGSYVIYCDVVYNNDNGEAYTLTERFAFTFEECKHTGGFTDEVCNICHNACDHKNIDTDTGICVCGRQFVASISTDGSAPIGYGTLADCLNSITADTENYVKIYQDIEEDSSQEYIVKYRVTLDLNGHRLDDELNINEKNSTDNSGELTLTGTGYINNVYAYSNTTFTIDDNANIEADTFFNNAGTRFTVSDGANVTVRYLAVKESISSEGNATSVKLATGTKITEMLAYDRDNSSPLSENIMLKNLLSDNQMLKYESSSKIIDLYYGASRIIINSKTYGYGTITVVEHTDADHTYDSATGKCKECGKPCEHGGDINTDNGKCSICGKVCGAVVIKADGTAVGYDGLAAAFAEAGNNNGYTLKLFSDYDLSEDINVSGEFTIDLNKKYIHCLNSKKITVGKNATISLTGNAGSNISKLRVTGGTLTVLADCSVSLDMLTVQDGKLSLYSGRVESLHIEAGADIALYGGFINDIFNNTGDTILLRSLLADGYAFATKDDSGTLTVANKYDSTISPFDNIKLYVVEHKTCSYDKDNPTGACKECGKPCEHGGDINTDNGICSVCGAVVSVAIYTDANGISKYVDTDELHSLLNEYGRSGTVKLFKDYYKFEQHDIDGVITIDLNGHDFTVKGVTPWSGGKVTFKNSGSEQVTCSGSVSPTVDAPGGTLIVDGDIYFSSAININDYGTVILNAGKYVDLTIKGDRTLCDMLGEGKAFFDADGNLFNASVQAGSDLTVKAHSHTYVDGKCDCGYVCPHSDVNIDTGKCTECEYQYAAVIVKDGAVASFYKETEMEAAFEAADSDENTGCTLRVYKNYTGNTTLSGKFTLWIAEKANVGKLTVSGDITVTGSEKYNSIYGDFDVADGGKLTFDENCGAKGTVSVGAGTFDCYYSLGITLNINDASSDVILHYGTFIKICYNGGGDRANAEILTLLAENRIFMSPSVGLIDGSKTLLKDGFATTVGVIRHEDHGYDSTTGKCTICGKRCGHTDVDSETGVCPTCKYQFAAIISGVETPSYFGNIDDAFAAATSGENNGCTLTLYQDCELTTDVIIEKALNLNVNGKTITTSDKEIIVKLGTLTLTGGGKVDGNVTVAGGTLINGINDTNDSKAVSITNLYANYIGEEPHIELYGGVYDSFTFNTYDPDVTIYGGSFGEIKSKSETSITVGSLLAKNRAFVRTLPAELIDGSAVTLYNGLTNVSVVEHEHRYNVETGKCPCGVCALAIFTETTQSSETYTFIESATQFKNIAENEADGVLKLTGDVDCIVKGIIINGNKTIDMNGHTLNVSVGTEEISAVAVYGNVTFENSGSKRAVINATGVYSHGMVTVNGDIEFGAFATFEDGDALINAGVFKSIYAQGRSVIEILGSGKALARESGEILNASVQQIYKAGDNIFVKAHPKHTYDDHGNCACGYKCLHDGEGQVNEDSANKVCSECGAKIYAKVTTADGKVKYFDDITEGLRYADKAENKGCVFTLVTTGGLENDITLSSGQFTITAIDDNYINAYTRKINIKGAEITVENCAFNCFVGLYSGSLTYPEGSTSVCINGISVFGGTLNISDGVSENFGANKFTISDTATDAKVTIGGGIYSEIKLGQYTFKDILASGTRLISVEYSQETDEIIATNELLYSIVSEQNTLGVDDDKDYRFVKCDHKNEDGSYAFNEGGICKYCGSEFAASVSYTDGSEKTELFGDIYDAFDKANEIGTATVTLQKNITDDITDTIAVTGNVTLELNGKRLSQPGTDVWYSIEVTSGKLTVNGSGLIKRVAVCNGSNAEINGGTFSDFIIKDGGNAVIKGGQFYSLQVSGEGRNVRQLLADGYAYWSLNKTGYWSTIAEREKQDIANVEVKEAPIKSASIAWVGEEAPVIYRNGEKYLYVDITYELAVGSRGATYSDFVNGNNRIKDYNLYNKYMVHCYEIGKLAAKDGEVEYYIVLKCNGYEYKSNVLKLTLATCSHPEDSFSYENDGFVICGICDALIEAEVVDADGKSLGYADIESAIKLAQENEGSTVKLMSEGVSESITVTGGRFTVDFNGKKVFYQFDVNGGDVTFTSSVKQADAETLISGITVNGTDAKVTIDGKIKLGSVTLTSGTLTVNSTDGYIKELSIEGGKTDIDGAEIDTLVFKGGDLAIRNVTVGSLDINKKATDATEHNIVIESGSVDTITCSDDSDYNIVKALASERRLRGTESGIIYEYSEIESLTEATEITVEKCDHKYANGNIAVDDDYVCYYCNSQIVATVSYTADGSEKTDLFGDICDAFDKANEASTATVTLRSDITGTLEREIKSVGNITLDLNGKKLTVSNEDEYTLTVWGGTFTVKGDGELYDLDVFKGKAVIQGGKIKALTVDGTAVISGGEFECIIVGGGKTAADLLEKGYAYKSTDDDTWLSIADRENSSISSVTVTEAPIKSATITAEDESPIIYRNGRKVASFTADVTYTGNETLYVTGCLIDGTVIKEKTDLSGNRYYLFSGEVDKAVAEDGEIQYYCIFTYDGYDYKSNAVTLTVATCRHPSESVKCDDNGNYVCGICDSTLLASVELSDGTLSYYNNRNDAIGAAEDSEGCTLKLLSYSFLNYNETFDISKGRFTVDFNKDDGSGRFTFNVKGGDITFTTSQATSNPWARVQVSGENANVLIDSKARLNSLVVNSGKVTVDGANIGAITINGGDMVINDVDTGLLSEEGNGSVNISIVSGRFESVVFDEYTFGKAIASGSRIRLTDADGGKIYKYAEIQNKGNAGVIVVEKCDHKDENDSYELDGNPCPYCNEEIVATVSYTADGSEQTDLFSDIYDAFAKANDVGTATVTLYKDITNSELTQGVTVTGNVTLALNGKKLGGTFAFNAPVEVSDGGMFTVGGDGKMRMPIKAYANSKLIINGGEFTSVMVYIDGDAEIGGGVIDALTIIGNAKAKISGGKFYNIEIANGSLESVLADGYAYKKDGGAWLSIAERAESVYSSVNNDNKPVNVEEAPIKSATISTKINKLYRNSNANPTLKFILALAVDPNLNDSDARMRYGINSYECGDTAYSSLSALLSNTKLSADDILMRAGDSDAAKIYYVVTTSDGYEIKSNTVSIDLVDCDHSQVVDPTADKEIAGNITEPTYCKICESKFNAKITKGDDVRYYNDLDEAAKDAQKSENEGCTLYPLYNKYGYNGWITITEGNFTLKYAVRTAFSNPVVIKGNAKLKVTGRCAVTESENQDAFTVNDGDVTFEGLATGSNVTINGGNVTMAGNNINCLTINGGNVSISSGGFAEIITNAENKVIADYIDPGFWVQDRGTKEWIDIYSLDKATASSTNVLSVRLCPMQIIKPIDTVYYTNGYYPDGIPSLEISAEPWYSDEVNANVAYQWIAIDENGYEAVIEGATDRKLSLENLTTGRYYCRLTYSNAVTAGVSMKSDVVTATITECEHSGGKATCTNKAKCEICGAEYGEMKPHSYAHIKASEYLKSAATCTAKAVYYTSCADCGQSSKGTADEATFEYGNALGHKYGAWVSNGDGTHTRVCANDSKHTETKDCHGGKATCTAKAICEDCGKAYGEMTAHTFTAKTATAKYLKTAATCTTKAVYYTSCADCGLSSKGTKNEATFEYGNALGHKYGKWVSNGDGTHTRVCANDSKHTETKACHGGKATCTAKAICEDCGKAYGEMTAHAFTVKTASAKYLKTAATCTAKAVYYTSCADCGLSSKGTKNEATFEYGNALGHKYGAWVSNGDGTHTRVCANDSKHTETKACHGGKATCTAKAICEDCGKAYGEMTAHTFTAKTASAKYLKSAATCTTKAVYYTSCADCGLSSKGTKNEATFEYGNALGHKYGKWVSNGDGTHTRVCANDSKHTETKNCHGGKATCTAKAICEDCGKAYGEMTAHTFTAKSTVSRYLKRAATCTEKSEYYVSCAGCGLSSKGTASEAVFTGSALGHSLTEWNVITEVTCTTNGTQERHCTRCDHKQTRTIVAKGHSYGLWNVTKKVGCVTDGEQSRECSVCGNKETKTIAATGVHSYGSWKVAKAATCTTAGTKVRSCSGCGAKETVIIQPTGHKYVESIVKPTYTEKGYTLHKCSACGTSYKSSYTDKLVLASVSGVKLAGRAADALRVSWDRNTSADGYIVEIYKDGAWARAGKITTDSTTDFKVTGLNASTFYKFRVRAYKMSGNTAVYSDYGTTLTARTNPSVIKGAKLAGRAADALRISWDRNTSADGYIVEIYKDGAWSRAVKTTNNSITTYRAEGLKASTVYKLRVRAYKMDGTAAYYGNYSAEVTARTNPSVIKGAKLAGRAADALRVSWDRNTSADGYIVEIYKDGAWSRAGKITTDSTTDFRVTGLKASTVYKLRVRAYKMSGTVAYYGNYSAEVTARTNPSVMTGVKIGGTAKDALRINWSKNTSAQGYIVEMVQNGEWVRVAKITDNSTTTFRKAGLAKNTSYRFRVCAYHMSGSTPLYGAYVSVSGKTAAN